MNVLTEALLVERQGPSEEAAEQICFLASEDATFISGAVFLVDGDALAWPGTGE